jgi:hypothetical protein
MKNKEFNLIVKFLVSLTILSAVHASFVQEFDQLVIQMLLFQSLLLTSFVTLVEVSHSLIVRVQKAKLPVMPRVNRLPETVTSTSNRML